ncbi:hypothetical protein GOV07_02470 [Candidatus Woesearchaeota archaeon]|nr:hypothetical protein [Candidatus Woesearchaeota archaeon]
MTLGPQYEVYVLGTGFFTDRMGGSYASPDALAQAIGDHARLVLNVRGIPDVKNLPGEVLKEGYIRLPLHRGDFCRLAEHLGLKMDE